MRDLFPGYYRHSEDDLKALWSQATFVFDTNVLLNLYSYPEEPRDAFWSALEKVSARAWIPYHVALEFHRNKFNRIKQSNKKLDGLLKTINSTSDQLSREVNLIELEKRRIGVSDIQARVTAVREAHEKLSEAVSLACERLPSVSLDDEIGEKICKLFEGRVGQPPADQGSLDALIADGQDRYDKKIPPGYEDQKTKGEDTFRDRGINYFRKFGDLIIWKQIIEHAEKNAVNDIVLITGDRKEDWWWIDDGKTIGPLPELVQEITTAGKINRFWMYTADQFLKLSQELLDVKGVTDEAIAQVKDLTDSDFSTEEEVGTRHPTNPQNPLLAYKTISSWLDRSTSVSSVLGLGRDSPRSLGMGYVPSDHVEAEDAVEQWLKQRFGESVYRNRDFPDFLVDTEQGAVAYEVRRLRNFEKFLFPPAIVQGMLRGYMEIHEGRVSEFNMVAVISGEDAYNIRSNGLEHDAERRVANLLSKYPITSMTVGWVEDDEFIPLFGVHGGQ